MASVAPRFSEWDGSDLAKFLYARAALSKNQIKLAHKIISPLVGREGATDQQMLLAARVNFRLGASKATQELLDRIPPNSALHQESEQLRARINPKNG
jgi:thioredoxin-like negative regulator of GroEL